MRQAVLDVDQRSTPSFFLVHPVMRCPFAGTAHSSVQVSISAYISQHSSGKDATCT